MEIILVFGVKLWNWACPQGPAAPGSDFVRVLTICRMSSLGPQTCRKQQRRLTAVTPRKWRFSRSEGTLYKDMSFSRHLADMCLTLYLVWQSKKNIGCKKVEFILARWWQISIEIITSLAFAARESEILDWICRVTNRIKFHEVKYFNYELSWCNYFTGRKLVTTIIYDCVIDK